jgi:two-component system sensor histidine kinase RegB
MHRSTRGEHDREQASTPWYLAATTLATVPWLIRLRWMRAAVDAAVIATAIALPGIDFPLRRVAPLLAATALMNAVAAVRLGRRQPLPRLLVTVDLVVQALLLTELLELTGGPFNPFVVVYAMPIALAGLTAGRAIGGLVAAVSVSGYTLLAYWHLTELVPGHHRLNDLPTHLYTLWMSMTLTAELAAHFLVQASNALARREEQLEAMRQQTARAERLVSLTTLAAGAAHELSTPLATIALAARELEHAATERGTVPDLADDARLIRTEVDRCRSILDQMSGRAGGSAVDEPEAFTVATLVSDVRARLPREGAARLTVEVAVGLPPLFLPRSGLTQAVLSLLANALDATAALEQPLVRLRIGRLDDGLAIAVIDNGNGIAPDVLHRAGEPFFTTKDPGRGLGLGLFLARVFAERIGGTLVLESREGTTATIQVPFTTVDSGVPS